MTDRGLYIRAAEIVGEVLQHPRSDHDARAVELCSDDEALLQEVRDLLRMQTLDLPPILVPVTMLLQGSLPVLPEGCGA